MKNRALYGLPEEVLFCKKCVISNQRPASIPEFKHKKNREDAKYMHIDNDGVCDACKHAEEKNNRLEKKRRRALKTA